MKRFVKKPEKQMSIEGINELSCFQNSQELVNRPGERKDLPGGLLKQ